MDLRAKIIKAKNRYCLETGLAPATVATKVMNDGKFFDRLEEGGGCTTDTYEKVMRWFRENRPPRKRNGKH